MIRLGEEPKGIFASGTVIKGSYESKQWLPARAKAGNTALFVDAEFEVLLDPKQDRILPLEQLKKPPFSKVNWTTQGAGITIPDDVAFKLEETWAELTGVDNFIFPEEDSVTTDTLYEGARRWISVNAFERNSTARKKCVDFYGTICSACELNFAEKYGEVGEGFIHIHHLKPLYKVDKEYEIDPIRDLRPVCPNCHAIIHMKKPPFTIKEVKKLLKKADVSKL